MLRRTSILVALWLAAFAAGLAADRPAAQAVHDRGWDDKAGWDKQTRALVEVVKLPGTYWAAAVAAVAVGFLHPLRWRAAGLVAGAGALSGTNGLLKWVVGRRRPVAGIHPFAVDPFVGGIRGLFGAEKNLSFPSGHACLAFATASALAICLPRWRWAFYAVALIVAVERVLENAHYVSDCVAAAGLGVLATAIVRAMLIRYASAPLTPARAGEV
jgi:membrane-associated phospholipid phosphatase